jgi:hypothetical protein
LRRDDESMMKGASGFHAAFILSGDNGVRTRRTEESMERTARERTSRHRTLAIGAACVLAALSVSACGGGDDQPGAGPRGSLPQGSVPVRLDPADFTTRIDNPYWPMALGSRWEYRSDEGRIVVTVTAKKKTVEGIEARVLRDMVTGEDGKPIEVTDDWYAQDSTGNVWYLGEDTKEYENGKISSTQGSWENGVDGAQAGIIMPARPDVGLSYRQEYYKGEAEDRAKVLGVDAKAKVPFGSFENALETEDTTPLEPDVVEHKFYVKGIGPVLKTSGSGGGREELVRFTKGG